MKAYPFGRAALWLAVGGLAGAQVRNEAVRTADGPAALAAQLRGFESSLSDQTESLKSLPQEWDVETPGRRYSISTSPLRTILASQRASRVEEARAWVDQLAAQLEGFAAEPASPAGGARARLDRILAHSEFGGSGPPSALGRFRDRVRAWVQDLLEKIFGFAASHPSGSQILFWIVLAGAVGFLALWLVRLWSRDAQLLKLPSPSLFTNESRTWEQWIAAARRAAAQGDSRQAIHCAYWAGIVRLQGVGALPADLTRTPREYLGLLPDATVSAGGAAREPLTALTGALERFWYASMAASNEDYRESLRHLAALGCKVE